MTERKICLYTYWEEKKSNEHYLLAHEIAQIFNIFSMSGKPHTILVGALLRDYIQSHGLKQYYYCSRQKMLPVFPQEVYSPAINILSQANNTITICNKNYKFKKGEMFECKNYISI